MWKILRTVKLRKNFPPFFFFPGDKYKTHCQSEEKGEKKAVLKTVILVFFSPYKRKL